MCTSVDRGVDWGKVGQWLRTKGGDELVLGMNVSTRWRNYSLSRATYLWVGTMFK